MKISAELILASKNAATGDVLTTLRLTYPRIILSEFNTHRALSRNTSSSRAVPGRKMRTAILREPFIPLYIGMKQKGMQAGEELRGWRRKAAESIIKLGRYPMVLQSWLLEKLGVAKQISNRYTEPWAWVTQVVTATDWKNLLLLRNHKDAEPHFRELARCIARELRTVDDVLSFKYQYTDPIAYRYPAQILAPGGWHIPFLGPDDIRSLPLDQKLKISAARAARTSYTVARSNISEWNADLELADKLIASKHMSPLEHQAQAVADFRYYGNIRSFIQYRKTIDGEDGGDRTAPQEVTQ